MKHTQPEPEPVPRPADGAGAPRSLELRHLRYFVAVADAGTFTHAAERIFIAQPTLSQQIRRLEQIVGTPLLHRRRDGVQLSAAGTMLLDAARDVLSMVEHGVSRTRQAAGLGRPRLRFVIPPRLPEALTVTTASALRSATDRAHGHKDSVRSGKPGGHGHGVIQANADGLQMRAVAEQPLGFPRIAHEHAHRSVGCD
jgi:Bacterial regulatory helix-turn-helix protein, lysR family